MAYGIHGSDNSVRCPHCNSLACGRGIIYASCRLDKTKPKPEKSTVGTFKNFLYKSK